MNLGKLILVLKEVLDWTIVIFSFLFVLVMANPEIE